MIDDLYGEIWKDIDGFEGIYKISNYGRVKSLYRVVNNHPMKEMIRSNSLTKDGYVKIRLLGNGKDITARVHRLVAKAFIPNPNNKETVNHKDGNKQNNRVDNLEWSDRSEQLYHAYSHNLKKQKRGSNNVNSKLSEEEVEEIRKIYKKGDREYGASALGRKYGVTHRTILNITNNLTYKQY